MEEQQSEQLSIVLAQLLTQEEFRLVWSLQFVAQAYGCYACEGMTEQEQRDRFSTLGAALVEGIRMAHQAGHRFAGIEVRDEELYPYQDAELNQGNGLYIGCLAAGLWFPFRRMLQGAIDLARREKLALDLDPLKQALDDIEWSITESTKDMTIEEAKEIFGNRMKRLSLGAALAQESEKAN
jgi:hypothetical protein